MKWEERRLKKKGSMRMTISDDAQHHSPSILDALLCEECDTFEEDLDAYDGDCERRPI